MTIEFSDYQKLVAQQAWKAHTRLHALKVYSMEFDDVYQEMCAFYSIALKTFDSSKGFCFSTYLVTVMQRQFKRLLDDLVEERKLISSVEEIEARGSHEEGFSLYDVIASNEPLLEDDISHKLDVLAKLNTLSDTSKLVLIELINPSIELQEEFEAKLAHCQFGRELGVAKGRMPHDLNIHMICEHHRLNSAEKRKIRTELKKNFGVDL